MNNFCLYRLDFKTKKILRFFSLLLITGVIEYTCKSVAETDYIKTLIIFPLIILGDRPEIAKFQGGHLFPSLRLQKRGLP